MGPLSVFFTVWKNAPVVAFLLFLLSTISLAIFLERFFNVKKSKVLPNNWSNIKLYLLNGNYNAALIALKKDKKPLAKILANLLEMYIKGEISKVELRQILEAESSIIYYQLSRGVSFISMSVTLSTLLGLVGTVFGLIEVFGAFSLTTPEGMKMLARGIATSLNSTAAGLFVAVFSYILYWIIKERINSVYSKVLKELEDLVELLK
ncbi:MAG: MotA/TolQ/ExbB proton channel family protein [Aquificae bacterium]|nr:MotA/TolQ/ExbB proton channel family protein [Aquificota bacterium]